MQPQQIPDVLLSLLNVPDLVILAVVLVNLILVDSVQTALCTAVQSMAESISYLVLIAVFSVLLSILISLAVRALRLLSRVTPLGMLDALAGGAIGLATGLLLVVLVLLGAHWFYPVTFTELGYLSPERIENTFLLAKIIAFLPFTAA